MIPRESHLEFHSRCIREAIDRFKQDGRRTAVLEEAWQRGSFCSAFNNVVPRKYDDTKLHQNFGNLPCYPIFRNGKFEIITGYVKVFRKINLSTGAITQLIYQCKNEDGKQRLEYCFLQKDSDVSADPIIFGDESEFLNFSKTGKGIDREVSICCSISDGVKIHDLTLAPVLVYDNIDSILNAVMPPSYQYNLWISESPDGSSRPLLIKIYKRYATLCNILEIGFYEDDIKDTQWCWSSEDIKQVEAQGEKYFCAPRMKKENKWVRVPR